MPPSLFFLLMFVSVAVPANGARLFINQRNPHPEYFPNYGYGLPAYGDLSLALDEAFGGAGNITVSGERLGDVSGYDALWVSLRSPSDPGLDAEEQANLAAFIASGKRTVIVGHNFTWTTWNKSFLSVLGGDYDGTILSNGMLTPYLVHPVTEGLSLLRVGDCGEAIGGTRLFSRNVVSQWGARRNVITVMSITALDHISFSGSYEQNRIFRRNIANWLASPIGTSAGTVIVTVNTNPAGNAVLVDGVTYSAERTFEWAPSTTHSLECTAPTGSSGSQCAGWSNGAATSHTVTTPASPATYTANYVNGTLANPSFTMLSLSGSTSAPGCATGSRAFTAIAQFRNEGLTEVDLIASVRTLTQGNRVTAQSWSPNPVAAGGVTTGTFSIELANCNRFQLYFDLLARQP